MIEPGSNLEGGRNFGDMRTIAEIEPFYVLEPWGDGVQSLAVMHLEDRHVRWAFLRIGGHGATSIHSELRDSEFFR